jgi:hypothetical protein
MKSIVLGVSYAWNSTPRAVSSRTIASMSTTSKMAHLLTDVRLAAPDRQLRPAPGPEPEREWLLVEQREAEPIGGERPRPHGRHFAPRTPPSTNRPEPSTKRDSSEAR